MQLTPCFWVKISAAFRSTLKTTLTAAAIARPAHPLPADVSGKQWPEPVRPHPHRLVAEIDPTLTGPRRS